MRSDGSYVGRSAPEIDIFEALVDDDGGKVSLSAQWGPYNVGNRAVSARPSLTTYYICIGRL